MKYVTISGLERLLIHEGTRRSCEKVAEGFRKLNPTLPVWVVSRSEYDRLTYAAGIGRARKVLDFLRNQQSPLDVINILNELDELLEATGHAY